MDIGISWVLIIFALLVAIIIFIIWVVSLKSPSIEWHLFKWFFIIIIVLAVSEVVILGIAFFGADEVDCNLLWCEFKTSRRTIENNTIISSNSECYKNGIKINCSNMPDVNSIINNAVGDIDGR